MREIAVRWLGIGGLSTLLALGVTAAARADDPVDPALASSWQFMQQAMPGVPYDVLKAACAEGNLTIYHGTWTDAQKAQVDRFRQRFPCIKVQLFEQEQGTMRARFMAEVNANHDMADIIQDSDPGTLDVYADEGILMNYKISNDASYDSALKRSGYWYPLRAAMVGNAWNTNMVTPDQAKKLESWQGAIDPAWAGHAAVVDPTAGGVGFAPWYAWDTLYGDDFIRKIGALKPRVFGGINPAAASLASGDVWVVLGASETGLTPLLAQGAPIRWSLPEPGVGPVTAQGIPAKAPHPDAARLYQEYAFTLEGYQIWQKLGGAPTRIGYKDQREVASQPWYHYPTGFFAYKTADATKANQRILDLVHGTVGGFK